MQRGDPAGGKLADNLIGFGRCLRRAGIALDSARMALASEALTLVDLARRDDVGAVLEAVLVSQQRDRDVFRELFDAYFRDPAIADKLPGQMLPGTEEQPEAPKVRPRVHDALAPRQSTPATGAPGSDPEAALDPARERRAGPAPASAQRSPKDEGIQVIASDLAGLRHADFRALSASEYQRVERLARAIRLPIPHYEARRTRPGARGVRLHWRGVMRSAARTGGEVLQLPRLQRRREPMPLLVLVDVSGSMERYARLLLAFLHVSTRQLRRRDVFAFGTHLTDLGEVMRLADTDQMLAAAGRSIDDFAGGTRLGHSLASLRRDHARCLVGRRTLVLLITDGLDTGAPQALGSELDWLCRHCHRLLWLNPLLRFVGYAPLARGAAELHARADGMLAVHNLEKLEELAASLAKLMAR
ncbi:MAG: VWA domain-containing protein [Betaproteobacteria bacterium]